MKTLAYKSDTDHQYGRRVSVRPPNRSTAALAGKPVFILRTTCIIRPMFEFAINEDTSTEELAKK